jgi:NAD(P)-dependent dehydrogenase (short-subunit alcohol dehydrogenase family)
MAQDPRTKYPQPPFAQQAQDSPGSSARMHPEPDHGELSYKGSSRLEGRVAVITGADSGIGRAVAIAYAREGADVVVAYLDEHEDAEKTARWVREAGRRVLLAPGDLSQREPCRALVDKAVAEFGRIDVLVNNAAYQHTRASIDEISDDEWEYTFAANVHSMFRVTKAAMAHMAPGSSIVNTSSVNFKHPMPSLLAYSATKAAIANFTAGLAQGAIEKGIRVNAVLPGPIWTPFIPTGMDAKQVTTFGSQSPYGRPGQPAELAAAYVMLAEENASFMSGAMVTVGGAMPIL